MTGPDGAPSIRQGFQNLSKENLDAFRQLIGMPGDQALQDLTIEQLIEHSKTRLRDGSDAEAASDDEVGTRYPQTTRFTPTACETKVATLILDAFLLAVGVVGIRAKAKQAAIDEITLLKMHMPARDITRVVVYIKDGDLKDKAWAIYRIVRLIFKAGMASAVWNAIVKSLSWLDMILYGVEGIAEIVAFVATDGVSQIALIVQELARAGFFTVDLLDVFAACPSESVGNQPRGRYLDVLITLQNERLFITGLAAQHTASMGWDNAVRLRVISPNVNRPLKDGEAVKLQTTETAAGARNLLAYVAPNVVYARANEQSTDFTLRHADSKMAQADFQDGDEILVVPASAAGRFLQSEGSGVAVGTRVTPWTVGFIRSNTDDPLNRQVSYGHIVKLVTFDGRAVIVDPSKPNYPAVGPADQALQFVIKNGQNSYPVMESQQQIELHTTIAGQDAVLGKYDGDERVQFTNSDFWRWTLHCPWNPPPAGGNHGWVIMYGDPVQLVNAEQTSLCPADGGDTDVGRFPMPIRRVRKDDALFYWTLEFVGFSYQP